MESDLTRLLNTDIEQAKTTLQNVLTELTLSPPTPALVEEGLCAAHTLKALAAVKEIPHLEQYAAQLEQLFIRAQQFQPEEIHKRINSDLRIIEREFREACRLAEQQTKPKLSDKLTALVENLYTMDQQLAQERYEAHMKELPPSEISVEHLFRSFVPWIQRAAEATQKDIQADLNITERIALQASTVAPLQTIMVHLLRNAVFHGMEAPSSRIRQGKPARGTIQLSAEVVDNMLILAISDDGRGMPEEDNDDPVHTPLKMLFQSESTTSAENTAVETSIYAVSNSQTGLGIGLHIVKSHVEKLGGEFEIKSIPHVGTCAIARIPLFAFRD